MSLMNVYIKPIKMNYDCLILLNDKNSSDLCCKSDIVVHMDDYIVTTNDDFKYFYFKSVDNKSKYVVVKEFYTVMCLEEGCIFQAKINPVVKKKLKRDIEKGVKRYGIEYVNILEGFKTKKEAEEYKNELLKNENILEDEKVKIKPIRRK